VGAKPIRADTLAGIAAGQPAAPTDAAGVTHSPGYSSPTWPPPWHGADPSQMRMHGFNRPTADQLDYAQKAITVTLLVLALPAIIAAFLKRPSDVIAGLGRKHVG
jgi:hypothetical protein